MPGFKGDPALFLESAGKVRHMLTFDSVMSFLSSPEYMAYGKSYVLLRNECFLKISLHELFNLTY